MRWSAVVCLLTISLAGCLTGGDDATTSSGTDAGAVDLSFLPPVALECTSPLHAQCGGYAEPVLEIAGDGTIWYSATPSPGEDTSPAIWTSRDGGESFQWLDFNTVGPVDLVRDAAVGIEGDFGIDAAGNVYFVDIAAAYGAVYVWQPDGALHHYGTWPFVPAVDRSWVRAGPEGEVYLTYFTKHKQIARLATDGEPTFDPIIDGAGLSIETVFYRSADYGMTWSPVPEASFPCAVGNTGQGPDPARLFLVGCGTYWIPSPGYLPTLWLSEDGGQTWADGEAIPLPEGFADEERLIHAFFVADADQAGNIYVTYLHNLDAPVDGVVQDEGVFVARRDIDGNWAGPWLVSGPGDADVPWLVAGAEGNVAVAWYQTDAKVADHQAADNEWYVHAAVAQDAAPGQHDEDGPSWTVVRADPEPVLIGPRNEAALGHFLTADLTPDGDLAIAYARDLGQAGPSGTPNAINLFVRSDGIDLSQGWFLNGPTPEGAA